MRADHDAILVGAGTVMADDPRLTARPPGAARRQPILRVVLDGQLRTPAGARLFAERGSPPPLVLAAAPPAGNRRSGGVRNGGDGPSRGPGPR